MNKYTETYKNKLTKETKIASIFSAAMPFISPVIGAARGAISNPKLMAGVGGAAVTGAGGVGLYDQLTGTDTMLGKARDFAYNLYGNESPTDSARNSVIGLENKRLQNRANLLKSNLPVSDSSASKGSLTKNIPSGAVSFFGGNSGSSLVENATEQYNKQNEANINSGINGSSGFLSKSEGTSPQMKTTNGLVETRRAQPVVRGQQSAAGTTASTGPTDAFLAKVMGSYNSKSVADRRRADIVRQIYKENPNVTPNQIYSDKRYIQDYQNFLNRNKRTRQ
jgi:hypothetical protein